MIRMPIERPFERVAIENIQPQVDGGRFPVKALAGEPVIVTADLIADGHGQLVADLLFKKSSESEWTRTPMHALGNDRWEGSFTPTELGDYLYTVEAQVDPLLTWIHDTESKIAAHLKPSVAIAIGQQMLSELAERQTPELCKRISSVIARMDPDNPKAALEIVQREALPIYLKSPDARCATRHAPELELWSERKRAVYGSWYELFPRSCGADGSHGTLRDVISLLPDIAAMGFDVLYLPPIHPIGHAARKGRNNVTEASASDVGSPWAIGSHEGGHKSVHPELGTLEDFQLLLVEAERLGLEIALDIAFQCSPDHPYVTEKRVWFKWRPDGSVQYAENPPKKYEDIIPLYFQTPDWQSLWEELKSIVLFWWELGVKIFRIDNPHTKPFVFWEWLIRSMRERDPSIIFLSEAFTRPKVMDRLAKLGFTQSYTYFTWRNTKLELQTYVNELFASPRRDFFRPNFWPNTPDILPEYLQYGGKAAFIARLILAGTLSSSYGIYGPAFELCLANGLPGKEEYGDSEKYELKAWEVSESETIRDCIKRLNAIRRSHRSLQTPWNVRFLEIDNDLLIAYYKRSEDLSEVVLVVVNLDPFHRQSGWLQIPLNLLEIQPDRPYLADDLLHDQRYVLQGERAFIELTPPDKCAHILCVKRETRREADFDYFL